MLLRYIKQLGFRVNLTFPSFISFSMFFQVKSGKCKANLFLYKQKVKEVTFLFRKANDQLQKLVPSYCALIFLLHPYFFFHFFYFNN